MSLMTVSDSSDEPRPLDTHWKKKTVREPTFMRLKTITATQRGLIHHTPRTGK